MEFFWVPLLLIAIIGVTFISLSEDSPGNFLCQIIIDVIFIVWFSFMLSNQFSWLILAVLIVDVILLPIHAFKLLNEI